MATPCRRETVKAGQHGCHSVSSPLKLSMGSPCRDGEVAVGVKPPQPRIILRPNGFWVRLHILGLGGSKGEQVCHQKAGKA